MQANANDGGDNRHAGTGGLLSGFNNTLDDGIQDKFTG